MADTKLFIATKNLDKIREITDALNGLDIDIVSIKDIPDLPDVDEDQDSLEGNAIKKAREFSQATGLPALADDTGLQVDALNGEPGVFSSRYAGPHAGYDENVDKLLKSLKGESNRKARFITVAALAWGDYLQTVKGVCDGEILTERRGTGKFGYDPVFYIPKYGKTFAEMPLELKNQISHRGKAMAQIKSMVQTLLESTSTAG